MRVAEFVLRADEESVRNQRQNEFDQLASVSGPIDPNSMR